MRSAGYAQSIFRGEFSQYAGWDNGAQFAWRLIGNALWTGFKAAFIRFSSKAFAGTESGASSALAFEAREFWAIFGSYAVAATLKYAYGVLVGGEEFSFFNLLIFVMIEGVLGALSTSVVFKHLPKEFVKVANSGEAGGRSMKIAMSTAIAYPFVSYSQDLFEDRWEKMQALKKAASMHNFKSS